MMRLFVIGFRGDNDILPWKGFIESTQSMMTSQQLKEKPSLMGHESTIRGGRVACAWMATVLIAGLLGGPRPANTLVTQTFVTRDSCHKPRRSID